MSQFSRTTERDEDPDAWAAEPGPGPQATAASGEAALNALGAAVSAVQAGLRGIDAHLVAATRYLLDDLRHGDLIATVAWMQDVKRDLGRLESWLAREVGRDDAAPDSPVVLTDGRIAELLRGADRKAWDHERWQHDARQAIVRAAGISDTDAVVNVATGEPVDLFALLAQAEAVHGATAPKVRALKSLGLDVGDYCETTGGYFTVKVSPAPESNPTTERNDA